jgi:DNA-binding response OmpR family regulator
MPEEKSLKLLIVEDDPGIATMLNAFFTSHDVNTQIAPDGKKALELITTFTPDIIILDIVLPYVDGLSVLDKLRSNSIQIPVILLTDKSSVEEKLTGFEHGADDYVTKPFSLKELWMRVQAILRRGQSVTLANEHRILSVGGLSINPLTRMINLLDSTTLSLTKTEFDLLYFLADRKNQAVPHTVILEEVMGYSPTSQTKALVIHIANIRKKFDAQGVTDIELQAVPGIGYKLIAIQPSETDVQEDLT